MASSGLLLIRGVGGGGRGGAPHHLHQQQKQLFSSFPNKNPLLRLSLLRFRNFSTPSALLPPNDVQEFAPKNRQVIDWFGQLQAADLQSIEPAVRAASNNYKRLSCSRGGKLITMRAATEMTPITSTESEVIAASEVEPPSIDFAFVSIRFSQFLFPDGTPDIHIRSACGGQKLRDIMLDSNIELYGPYARFLLNCGGGGTCGTCMVEVIEGKELLSLRTDREKEILKRKPKTWRLACQTTVSKQDSRGEVVIQQLPEWKVHQWTYDKAAAAAEAAEPE